MERGSNIMEGVDAEWWLERGLPPLGSKQAGCTGEGILGVCRRIAASSLSDICKHSPELAQTVVDAGAVSLSILQPKAMMSRIIMNLYGFWR